MTDDETHGVEVVDGIRYARPSGDLVYPAAIRAREWWVAWILDGAERKRPVAPWQTRHAYPVEWRGDLPTEDRPETDFETAKRWTDFPLSNLGLSLPDDAKSDGLNLGIILPTDRPARAERVVLIDWDDVRDPDTEEVHPVAAAVIQNYGGYVEISGSGKGLHQYVFGGLRHRDKFIAPIDAEPFVGDDAPQVEIYDGGRHVAMTGQHVAGTDRDLVDGQACIDALVAEYAGAELDAGYRRRDPAPDATSDADTNQDGTATDDGTDDQAQDQTAVPEPTPSEYEGPPIDDLRLSKPTDRSLTYHAVVEAFCEGSAGVLNWRLEGAAAALGERDGLDAETVIADLRGENRDGRSTGYDRKTPRRVEYDYTRAARGEFHPPTWETLADWGVVPRAADVDGHLGEPVAAIPFGALASMQVDERRRYARRRGKEWPDDAEVSERIHDAMTDVLADEEYEVLRAPTGTDKSGNAVETRWRDVDSAVTGDRPVVVFAGTREARDQAVARAKAAGIGGDEIKVLMGHTELCPVAGGVYDPANVEDDERDPLTIDDMPAGEWLTHQVTEKGVPFSVAHKRAREKLRQRGTAMPCCPGEQKCRTATQWPANGFTDDDGRPRYELVIATDPFAFVPSLRARTNIIHDEQPNYTEAFGLDRSNYATAEAYHQALTGRVREMVTAYLGLTDDGPDTFETLVERAREFGDHPADPWNEHAAPAERPDEELVERARRARDALRHDPPREWYFTDRRAHTLAPAVARGIWYALQNDPDANGRLSTTVSHHPPRFDDDARDGNEWNRTWVTVTLDSDNTIRQVRNAPDFTPARSVVGLDARPNPWQWQRNVHPDMTVEPVLDPDEARLWRRFERGQTVVQLGDATRVPGRNGAFFNERHAEALTAALRDHFGDEFSSFGGPSDFEAPLREAFQEVGVPADEIASMHYGEEKSRDDFADELVGLVYGCIDPGDDYVLDMLAECALDARPKMGECQECGGTGCPGDPDCHDGQRRAPGREFVGPDADHAQAILDSVRATHVAQMVGRFGRDLNDDEHNVTVVASTALPDDLVDVRAPGVEWLPTNLQRQVVGELANRSSATTRELGAAADCTKEHVRQTLTHLEDRGVVTRRRRAASHGADDWRADRDLNPDAAGLGTVQVGLDSISPPAEITNDALRDHSKWSLAVSQPAGRAEGLTPARPVTTDDEPPPALSERGQEPAD